MDSSCSPDDAELFDFLDEYHRDLDAGREVSLAVYLKRFPGHEESIAREFVRLRGAPLAPSEEPQPKDERRIGPYQLLRELGSGGQGAVWLAEDTRIARQVALKFMPSSFAMLSSERRRRFQREAEVVSRLEHASICPVYEAQIDHEPPYIAMRLVEGETLAAAIARARVGDRDTSGALPLPPRDPVELRRVLSFFERAARALHAAHEAGVVHRDFKPGNVMVSKSGEPVIVDFGQARDERADLSERTVSGEVLGTPAYMSPEQVAGAAHGLDRRTDVWSLGASLYEALTLVRPFYGESVAALMHSVRTSPLPDPRRLSKVIDEDVAVVLETALEKDLPRRYPTALEFAEDLRRIREYEPIRARAASPLLKLRRWAQRHPALAFAVLAISVGVIWSVYLMRRETAALGARSEAQQREIQALQREANAIDSALGRYLAVRVNDVLAEDPAAALAIALKAVDLAPGYQARSAVFSALNECWLASVIEATDEDSTDDLEISSNATRTVGIEFDPIQDLDISQDATRIVGGMFKGKVYVWDLYTGHQLLSIDVAKGQQIARVRFSADASYFVAGAADGTLRSHRTIDGAKLGELATLGDVITALEFIPDGDRWIALTRDGHGVIAEGAELNVSARFEVDAQSFNELRVSRDGKFALAASTQPARTNPLKCNHALVLDLRDGCVLATLIGHADAIAASDISPDGERAATASIDGTVRLWSLPDGAPIDEPLVHNAPLSCVRFARDGRHVFSGTDAETRSGVWLWDLASRTSRELKAQHSSRIESIDVCERDGDVVVSSRDTSISIWGEDGRLRNMLRERLRPVSVRWTRDGSRLVTLAINVYSHVWWGENRPDVYELEGHTAPIRSAGFTHRGDRAWTLSGDGVARLWHTPRNERERGELEPGVELARFGTPEDEVVLARVGWLDRLLLMTRHGRVGWLDEESNELVNQRCIDGAAVDVDMAVGDFGNSLVVVTDSGGVFKLSYACVPEKFVRIAGDATVARFVNEFEIVLGGSDDRLRLVRGDGELLREITWSSKSSAHGIFDLAVRPDGREIAFACRDGQLRFVSLDGHADPSDRVVIFMTNTLTYDSLGKHLLAVGPRGHSAVRIWHAPERRPVFEQIFHTAELTGGSFDPSGRFVLTSSKDRSVYVREAATGEPFARRGDFDSAVTCAAFSTDDGELRVISGCESGRVSVWPVDPTRAARARQPRDLSPIEDQLEARLAAPLPYR